MSLLLVLIVLAVLIGGGMWGWPLVAGFLGATSVKDRSSALNHIARLMREFEISPAEVEATLRAAAVEQPREKPSTSNVAKTLFIYLGAIFIFAGISAYIATFWDSMGSVMRVLVTLGVGYTLLIVLVSALHESKYPKLILPLALASVFVTTGGWFVFIHEVFPKGDDWRLATLAVFGVMAVHQGALFAKYRLTVLAFTVLFFAYGFMQVGFDLLDVPTGLIAIVLGASLFLVATALEKTAHRILAEPALFIAICWLNSGLFDRLAIAKSSEWAGLIVGICLLFTAYGLQKTERYPRLTGLGYFFGSILGYAALFDLVHNTSIELLYLAAAASMLYVCLVLQSRALLFTTVIAMLSFIGYFTAKHFADSLGWPVTLVLMGIAFLGVGTLAIKIKRQM